jgi:hypothetical protein
MIRFLHGNKFVGVVPYISANLTTCQFVLASTPGKKQCPMCACIDRIHTHRQLFEHIIDAQLYAVCWWQLRVRGKGHQVSSRSGIGIVCLCIHVVLSLSHTPLPLCSSSQTTGGDISVTSGTSFASTLATTDVESSSVDTNSHDKTKATKATKTEKAPKTKAAESACDGDWGARLRASRVLCASQCRHLC